MRRVRKLEEAAKKNFSKIKVDNFIMSNATRISFEVSRQKWEEIERSAEWAAVKGMIESGIKSGEPKEMQCVS